MNAPGTRARLIRSLRPYRWQLAAILLCMLADVLYPLLERLILGKYLIDYAITPRNARLLVLILVGVGTAAVLDGLISVLRSKLSARVSAQVIGDLRVQLFDQLQRLAHGFFMRTGPGQVLSPFTSDLASVENAMRKSLPTALINAITAALGAVLLFTLDWYLAVIAVLCLPLSLIGPTLIGRLMKSADSAMSKEQARLHAAVAENAAAHAVVQAFGHQPAARDQFRSLTDGLTIASARATFLGYMTERTTQAGILLVTMIVAACSAWLTLSGSITIGTMVAFIALFSRVRWSFSGATRVIPELTRAASGLRRIEALLDEQPEVADAPAARELPRMCREIAFTDVTFGYTSDRLILDGVSLAIPQGSSVAVVGPSGSGKTTLLNLALRFYDPNSGSVTFDDHDLRHIRQDSLHSQTGVVLQESFLFNDTIAANIRIGKPDASDAELDAAARAADIHDLISSLPAGYGTPVGERGRRLSAGQRQRIAIARALLRDPAILILDEATAALDPGSEAAIHQTLRRIGKGRTILQVTHRLSMITELDRIFVLNGGKIVQQGAHAELLRQGGLYAELWGKQSGFGVSADGTAATVAPERLRQLPLFAGMDETLLAETARLLVTEHYPEGRTVVQQGDPGDRFYLIARGKVAVMQATAAGERRMALLADGDHFGEIALLDRVPRTATISTLQPTTLLSLHRDAFAQLLARMPALQQQLAQVAAVRVRELAETAG